MASLAWVVFKTPVGWLVALTTTPRRDPYYLLLACRFIVFSTVFFIFKGSGVPQLFAALRAAKIIDN